MLLTKSNPDYEEEYNSWRRHGWGEDFVANENFNFDVNNEEESLISLVNYLFLAMANREATEAEMTLFKEHMLQEEDNVNILRSNFNMVRTYTDLETQTKKREEYKRNIAIIVLDYISRLTDTYTLKEVQ